MVTPTSGGLALLTLFAMRFSAGWCGRDPTEGCLRSADACGLQVLIAPIRPVPCHVRSKFFFPLDACLEAFQNDRIRAQSPVSPDVLVPLGQVREPDEEIVDGHRKFFESDQRHRDRLELDFDDDSKPPDRHGGRAPLFKRAA